MSKKHILFLLAGLSFLALNFVTHEKAEELTVREVEVPENFDELFFTTVYPSFPVSEQNNRVKSLSETFYRTSQGLVVSQGLKPVKKARVTGTIYKPTYPMTDITASGKKIDTLHASAHRWIAVSRDLQREGFTFGTKVLISGTGSHDGIWEVQDVMNRRWHRRIDFLSDLDAPNNYWEDVVITKLN